MCDDNVKTAAVHRALFRGPIAVQSTDADPCCVDNNSSSSSSSWRQVLCTPLKTAATLHCQHTRTHSLSLCLSACMCVGARVWYRGAACRVSVCGPLHVSVTRRGCPLRGRQSQIKYRRTTPPRLHAIYLLSAIETWAIQVTATRRLEAQLSQRGRAMLRVVKNFAKSLKIVQGHWK